MLMSLCNATLVTCKLCSRELNPVSVHLNVTVQYLAPHAMYKDSCDNSGVS